MNWFKRNKIVTVSQYKEIVSVDRGDFDNDIDYNIALLSIYLDLPMETVENMEMNKLNRLMDEVHVDINKIKTFNKEIKTKVGKLYSFPFEQLTIGEFIDLEHLLVDKNYLQNINKIFVILYRNKIKGDVFNPDKVEPYGYYLDHRAPLFDEVDITEVIGIVFAYLKFRSNILTVYEGLFNAADEVTEVDEDYQETAKERMEREKEEEKRNKWGWDSILFRLANNDPSKVDQATNLPLIQALNTISMIRELKLDQA